jgi:hypothetical protein
MKIFDRLGLNTKFYTVSNQSVPTLVSSSWIKLIIFLQIASPLSQTRVSRSKVLTLQKDRGWPTFPLLLFFFFLVNQLLVTVVSCQSASGELSPSINVTLENNAVMASVVKREDRKSLRFFVS